MRFVSPPTLDGALAALAEEDAVALGGGTSLALLVRAGLVEPAVLVSLGQLAELVGITERDGALVIGAATTLRDVAADARVRSALPALALAASEVGNPRVRSVATIGGALAHADPRQDVPPALIAYRAVLHLRSVSGGRTVALEEFATGFLETVLGDDEVITEVVVPLRARLTSHYLRFTPGSDQDYPLVGVAAALSSDASGRIASADVALGGVASRAVAVPAVAAVLQGEAPSPELIRRAAASAAGAVSDRSDRNGSARYRRAVTEVLVRRALEACLQ